MAELSYIIDEEGGTEIPLQIDLIYGAETTASSSVTDIPLETGRKIVDNVIQDPLKFSLRCIVSDLVSEEGRDSSQPKKSWAQLRDLMKRKTLLTLQTQMETYENLIIKQLTSPENYQTGKSLIFDLSLAQIEFIDINVATLSAQIVAPESPATNRTSQVNLGPVQPEEQRAVRKVSAYGVEYEVPL